MKSTKSRAGVILHPLLRATAAVAVLLSPTLAVRAAADQAAEKEGIKGIYDSLKKVELDPARSVKVDNLQIGHDLMDITLVSGRLFFAKPWKEGERPTAAVFVGVGRAKLTPVNKLELHQFKKAYNDKESLDEPFKHAFIRFDGDLYDQLKDKMEPERADDETVRLFEKRQKALEDFFFADPDFQVIQKTLSSLPVAGPRLVEFEGEKEGWLSYFHVPEGDVFGAEENRLVRHLRIGRSDFSNFILSVWHDKECYARGGDLEKEDHDSIEINNYDADFTVLKEGLLLDAKVRIDLEPKVPEISTARFDFIRYYDFFGKQKEFKVRSVTLPDGSPLPYLHSEGGALLVQFDKPVRKGEQKSVVVSYTADFIRPNPSVGSFLGNNVPPRLDVLDAEATTFSLLNTFPWFPQYGFLKRYTFDWRIKVPKPYIASGSGVTEKRWEEGPYNCVHKVEKEKVALSSWLFGRYIEYTDPKDTVRPKIYVYGLPKQQRQLEGLYREARNVVNWYEQWANPFPYDELDIVQMGFFYGFGQAPPGLVQLTGEAYLSQPQIVDIAAANPRLQPTFVHAFVAHEIGHQWFGHVVSWSSSHDQWLSESYTEYMSGLYVGNLLGEKAFVEKLRQWKERAELVPDGGSIWLGQRNGKWYTDVTYNKGPYVLHMLRLDLQAQLGPEEGNKMFFTAMKAFLDRYRHQNATTNDFVQAVSQTTRKDYAPFFNQWFRDTGIPEIQFTYTVRQTEDGKYLVSMKTVQPDKENLKQLRLPVALYFGDKKIVKFMAVSQAENTMQIKVPTSPDKVIANTDDGVLARVKSEKG